MESQPNSGPSSPEEVNSYLVQKEKKKQYNREYYHTVVKKKKETLEKQKELTDDYQAQLQILKNEIVRLQNSIKTLTQEKEQLLILNKRHLLPSLN